MFDRFIAWLIAWLSDDADLMDTVARVMAAEAQPDIDL